ncbi:MAG TPA: hypothetical protein VMZ50_10415 [Phycisphaerae bacterium]|nr:hypothetical protein [Phycisphaerae bacterium]
MNSDEDLLLFLGLAVILAGLAVPFVDLSDRSRQSDIDRFSGTSSFGATSTKLHYSLWRLPGFKYSAAILLVLFGALCALTGLGLLPW